MLKITLTKGLVGKRETQRKVVSALGLSKYGSSVTRADTPTIRGMVNKVSHLLTVTEVSGEKTKTKEKKQQSTATGPEGGNNNEAKARRGAVL